VYCASRGPLLKRRWLVQVPLDAVDLSHVSILYTQGEMAAITPIYDYNFQVSRPLLVPT
jgi:hypothetical protein